MGGSPFILGAEKTHIQDDPETRERLRMQFRDAHRLDLKEVLDPPLASIVRAVIGRTRFVEQAIAEVGVRWGESAPQPLGQLFYAVLRRPVLLEFLSDITGCGELDGVSGAASEYSAAGGSLDWHDDQKRSPRRRLAITINLSERAYTGGEFEMRTKSTRRMLANHIYPTFGSALIFRVSPDLEHRVLPVTGGGPRRVFSGWFLGPP